MVKVALITGGTSGMGLDVAQQLDKTGAWKVHIIGSNKERGENAAASLENTTFHQVDVKSYDEQGAAFDEIFNEHQRLDFVFVNAGIAQNVNTMYTYHDTTGIPPRPIPSSNGIEGVLDINLTGAIYTSYLAMHYFRRSPEETRGERHLILTSSIGGIYPCVHTPIYVATKHAMIGFTRSMAPRLWRDGIKMNAICPGTVITPLLTDEIKAFFDKAALIKMSHVTDVVFKCISGHEMTDSKGVSVPADELFGRSILISVERFFFVEMPELFDEPMRITYKGMVEGCL
ncbi:hypothetical protein N7478_004215 [Penicillium angulare]|uniref:uncharacterized protein n=1 Tax=Penicillium angulare TaxID=116970 RepID=UPI002541206A|nr:uncharacterized protein N7478_004215 [Penicillium angulare]KAJ5278843.1 hypothetical protein N7478_004215 [Penicillium angulare]